MHAYITLAPSGDGCSKLGTETELHSLFILMKMLIILDYINLHLLLLVALLGQQNILPKMKIPSICLWLTWREKLHVKYLTKYDI
jgi:hypothetical protein